MTDYDHTGRSVFARESHVGLDYPARAMWHFVVKAGHVKTRPGWGICHRSHGFLLQFVLHGRGLIKLRNTPFVAKKDDLIFLNCNSAYELKADPQAPWEFYWVVFDSAVAHLWIEALECDQKPVLRPLRPGPSTSRFRRILGLARRTPPGFEAELSAMVHLIVAKLFSERARQKAKTSEPAVAKRQLHLQQTRPYAVRRIIDYLAQSFFRPITAADLVKQSGLGHTQLYAAFRKSLGVSPMAYLGRYRLRHAQDLLQHTSLPIKEIGLQVGIPDVNYLSRLFRQKVGVSPRQYRAQTHRRLHPRLAG